MSNESWTLQKEHQVGQYKSTTLVIPQENQAQEEAKERLMLYLPEKNNPKHGRLKNSITLVLPEHLRKQREHHEYKTLLVSEESPVKEVQYTKLKTLKLEQPSPPPFSNWKGAELRKACKDRHIPTDGTNAAMKRRPNTTQGGRIYQKDEKLRNERWGKSRCGPR